MRSIAPRLVGHHIRACMTNKASEDAWKSKSTHSVGHPIVNFERVLIHVILDLISCMSDWRSAVAAQVNICFFTQGVCRYVSESVPSG